MAGELEGEGGGLPQADAAQEDGWQKGWEEKFGDILNIIVSQLKTAAGVLNVIYTCGRKKETFVIVIVCFV